MGPGYITVPIALFGWIPVVIALFAVLPARRAVLVAVVVAWLFLPMAGYRLSGLPDYSKATATSLGVLLGTLMFEPRRVFAFRPSWGDLPLAICCLSPFVTSWQNGLGLHDGASTALTQFVLWGLPYLAGRLYFSDLAGLRSIAVAIFIGGLIYIPFCLFEIRMSPQLHKLVYGFHQHSFGQTKRLGGYRPMVFMQHGLMVGMWMTAASLVGVWLWRAGTLRRALGLPIAYIVPPLLITTVLCKSLGAMALLVMGLGALFSSHALRTRLIVLGLAAAPLLYVGTRVSGVWTGDNVVRIVEAIDPARAQSLESRFRNENMLVHRAVARPLFGWGGAGRSRVTDEVSGKDLAATDGFWVIALGKQGLVGLVSVFLTLLVPPVLFLARWSPRRWTHPALAGPAAIAILLLLYTIDCLLNAMINPAFLLGAGGLVGLCSTRPRHGAGAAMTRPGATRPAPARPVGCPSARGRPAVTTGARTA